MIKIDCISDLHGYLPDLEDGGDLLIIAGDLTGHGRQAQLAQFRQWAEKQPYEKIIVIAGNHDGYLEKHPTHFTYADFSYLCDSGTMYKDLKIWGSPYTPEFCNWHFMLDRGSIELQEKWDMIPESTDILITHGPPLGILDESADEVKCGCGDLRRRLGHLPNLKLHVFGHIHEGYGTYRFPYDKYPIFVNASIMNERYEPVNKPITVEL